MTIPVAPAFLAPAIPAPAIPVTVVVCTRNEAANIGACLAALTRFDQVLVVDSDSTDATVAIARDHGALVIRFVWNGQYPKKKQWSLDLEAIRHDWVMHVDADEIVTPELAAEIAALMAHGPRHGGYFIRGQPVFLGRRLRFGLHNGKLMLVDRRRARFPRCDDLDAAGGWEVEGHYQPVIEGSVDRLRHPVLHWDRKPLAAWLDRHNRYSDWEAALRRDGRMAGLAAAESRRRRWLKAAFGASPSRGLAAFLYGYVVRLGFLDGTAGLHFALAKSFYYWQIDVKLRDPAAVSASAVAEAAVQPWPAAPEHEADPLQGADGCDGRGRQAQQVAPDARLLEPAERCGTL